MFGCVTSYQLTVPRSLNVVPRDCASSWVLTEVKLWGGDGRGRGYHAPNIIHDTKSVWCSHRGSNPVTLTVKVSLVLSFRNLLRKFAEEGTSLGDTAS